MADTSTIKNLKNDDFRKLLATPASGSQSSSSHANSSASHSFTHRKAPPAGVASSKSKKKFYPPKEKVKKEEGEEGEVDNLYLESQAKLNEIMQKYRDRAGERRKGVTPGDDAEFLRAKLTAAYKAVPGSAKAAASMAERRKMEIQESKYLGGDIEHTHLVKGLDYSLLNKVRNEIEDTDDKDELENVYELDIQSQQPVEQVASNKMVRNVCRTLFHTELPVKNEMFAKGRMAYVVELDDEEEDVPSTLMRSVLDSRVDVSEHINADNLLINKLTQVLSYLRTDLKKRKRGEGAEDGNKQKIFDDVEEEYLPSKTRESGHETITAPSTEETVRKKVKSPLTSRAALVSPETEIETVEITEITTAENTMTETLAELLKNVVECLSKEEQRLKKRRMEEEDDAYAELYPGGIALLDAVGGESDEEADFSKMDMGNRKGPVKRWDFESDQQYADYQESREAMPKAAYQYGVKMNGGRKTKKNAAVAGEKKNESLGAALPTYRNRPSGGGADLSFNSMRSMFETISKPEVRNGLASLAKNPLVQKTAIAVANNPQARSAAISAVQNPSMQQFALRSFTNSTNESSSKPNFDDITRQFESKPVVMQSAHSGLTSQSQFKPMFNSNAQSGNGPKQIYPSLSSMDPFDFPPQLPPSPTSRNFSEQLNQKSYWSYNTNSTTSFQTKPKKQPLAGLHLPK
uniref:Protein Red n=1 Tax=Ditylenchus dipsaci TaxID=166011 RepID=A0A915CN83_9BILA